jgi:hypothetical protein
VKAGEDGGEAGTSRVEHANEALRGESAFAVRGKAQAGGFFNENQAHEVSSGLNGLIFSRGKSKESLSLSDRSLGRCDAPPLPRTDCFRGVTD